MRNRRDEDTEPRKKRRRAAPDARIPEGPQPGGPPAMPPGGFAVPVTEGEIWHDGWSEIRPRDPAEPNLR